ncbi:MAG: hypothetical protein AAF382_09875 [Pseudomonadota bacterium]
MQISILLPLILISGTGSDAQIKSTAKMQQHAVVQDMFDGCRSPVLDTTEASRILYDAQLGETEVAPDAPLFIARCGSEFVLFTRPDSEVDVLYARFQDGTYDLIEARRG